MAENKTIEQRIDSIETRFEMFMKSQDERFNTFMQELHQQREDMRLLQERQDAMQEKHDADMKAAQEKHNADIHEMNERFYGKIDDLSKQINDTWKQTMIGVGGMIIALGALLITALK